jgi:hypothetical protein
LWAAYQAHFGTDSPTLVWQAPTRVMNPSFPARTVAAALEEDHARNSAEYLAEFRTDVDSFVAREVIDACVSPGVFERAPLLNVNYLGYADPSGGTSDSFTIAVAHKEGETVVLDCLRERRPPFNPETVVAEFANC